MERVWEEWLEFFLEGTETTARQAADSIVQILHLFEADQKKIRAMGRKAASSLAVHEYLQAHPLTKIGPAAKDLKLSVPTVTSALETLTKLKIAKESTGKRRDRLFGYPRYLHILSEYRRCTGFRFPCGVANGANQRRVGRSVKPTSQE
ncbi:MAG: hypothetical protein WB630_11335 [Candidatus Acidiferrales bacterium]